MKKETKAKIYKTLIIVAVVALIFLAIFLPVYFTGMLDKINSTEEMEKLIISGGIWSYLIFFAIQFLQVTFIPIPAAITTVAGTLVFGPWITLAVSFLAVIVASIFSFFLGRKIGKKIVIWIAGENAYKNWAEKIGKGKYVFFLMMLFPVFPDDILCMVAGTTTMTWRFFIITNIITRPIGIFCTCFLSGGFIPFAGWWIALWIFLAIICLALFILSYKYQPEIENFILKLAGKLDRKEQSLNKQNLPTVESSEIEIENNQTNNKDHHDANAPPHNLTN